MWGVGWGGTDAAGVADAVLLPARQRACALRSDALSVARRARRHMQHMRFQPACVWVSGECGLGGVSVAPCRPRRTCPSVCHTVTQSTVTLAAATTCPSSTQTIKITLCPLPTGAAAPRRRRNTPPPPWWWPRPPRGTRAVCTVQPRAPRQAPRTPPTHGLTPNTNTMSMPLGGAVRRAVRRRDFSPPRCLSLPLSSC